MPRAAGKTRERILDAAYRLFYRDGFARVGVDAVAAAAGVTKRTLYYHFASKDALLAAVLDAQHELVLRQIEGWAGAATGDAQAMVGRLFAAIATWAAKPRWQGSGFTRAAMELAGLPGHPARLAARRHKKAVEDWLAGRLVQGGVADPRDRARQIMVLIEGCLALILIHGDAGYAHAAAAVAERLVQGAPRCRLKRS